MSSLPSLQNAAGNLQRLNKTTHFGLLLQRKCACGGPASRLDGECEPCKAKRLQIKLSVGASNDPLEQEAERVADQVVALSPRSDLRTRPPRIQRLTGHTTDAGIALASVDRVLAGCGQPLDPVLRQDFGQRFGRDFSQVRVHTGAAAEQSARDVDAHAYTVGQDIVFGAGRFAPGTRDGQRLIAHELTHIVQQSINSDITKASLGDVAPVKARASSKIIQRYGHSVQDCKGEDVRKVIGPGNSLARQWLNEAIADLGKNPLPGYCSKLFPCYFRTATPDVAKIRHNLQTLQARFNSSDYFYDCRYDCPSSKTSKTMGMTKVSWLLGGSGPIVLCMNNFRGQMRPDWLAAETIIHEFCHRYLNFTADDYCDNCCEGIGASTALKNPASYSNFVMDLHFERLSAQRKAARKP